MEPVQGVSLAQLLGAMSLGVDLGLGQSEGHVARVCMLARHLGQLCGTSPQTQSELYYVALMGWVGCIADSSAAAAFFGDDIAYRSGVYDQDMKPLPFLGYLLRHAGTGRPWPVRAGRAAVLLATGAGAVQASLRSHCQVSSLIARRLGMDQAVWTALGQVFARWDGLGLPRGTGGGQLRESIRLWHIADVAMARATSEGPQAAAQVVRERCGTQFDPRLGATFCANSRRLLRQVPGEPGELFRQLQETDPGSRLPLAPDELDAALGALGDWVDLKSPFYAGHSAAVARLCDGAARHLGLDAARRRLLRRAGMVHELGRTGISNIILDKPGELTAAETVRLRMLPYFTERMLASPPALREIGSLAALAHEKLDGSGYPHGYGAAQLPPEARILAATETYRTALEARPGTTGLEPAQAARRIRRQAAQGVLDGPSVEAVLRVAGHASAAVTGPAGLTPRELQVLRHLAHGQTNRQIAARLGISGKTVGNHVEHVYAKAGVNTRAAASYFAMAHGLV